ncbi:MAG: tetratricopeptide repeat protein, partial [Arenimonas sp.]
MAERSRLDLKFALRLLLIVLLLGLAWRSLSLGIADTKSRSAPEQALQWRPRHSAALFWLAEQQAKNPANFPAAKANALSALRAYPFEGRAYRVLAQIADAEKKPELAFDLFQKALSYSPRDLESHLWLLNYYLRSENADAAVHHLDRLLRMQIDLLPPLMPTIGGLAVQPTSQEALVGQMEKNPPWRSPALKTLMAKEGAAETYAVFVNRMAKTQGGLTESEQQAWLAALNQGQQWSLAYLMWANQLPATMQLELSNLFNGGFEHEPLGGEFDWQFDQIPGATIELGSRDGAIGNKALRVSFDYRRVAFSGVRQILVLPAGHYRLTGQGLADDLRTDLGLVWSVQCMG